MGVSVVIPSYNGARLLPDTLTALQQLGAAVSEIILVDDGSTDGSVSLVRQRFPQVRVIERGRNTAMVNRSRNLGLAAARHRYVFVMDNDIEILPGCLNTLASVLEGSDRAVCATPRLVDGDDPRRIHADGNRLEFLGVSGRGRRGLLVEDVGTPPPAPTFGGGIMLIDTERLEAVGGFDEDYKFGWGEDGELQLRCRMVGMEALHVPAAVCVHTNHGRGSERALGQLYNRYLLILSYYRIRTLLLLAPSLLTFEVVLSALSVFQGFWRERFRSAGLILGGWRLVLGKRRRLQLDRQVSDVELLHSGGFELPLFMRDKATLAFAASALDRAARANWYLTRRWL